MTESASYQLGELGWLQFERLCELVLQALTGVRVQRWQGHADGCRRAVVNEPVRFGARGSNAAPVGLVLCWCRRVNAAGGTAAELAERWTDLLGDPAYADLKHLVMCVSLDAEVVEPLLRPALPAGVALTVLGVRELGEGIDAHAEVRAALPSVLGLRDLEALISREARTRSSFALGEAQALARVFWPTRAYEHARAVLARHCFVVLTGPPEMGKTAIAKMIALAQLTDGWEAHDCTDPDQMRQAFDGARAQAFIADDAFGSTEYRPDSAERWALALGELLPMLDARHWLIWTSRPAPLRAGLSRVQRERGAERFPAPAEVLVDAGDLDLEEKTLILFRHAKARGVGGLARTFIQSAGIFIVEHPHFTPERIRRFVNDHVGVWQKVPDNMLVVADGVLSSPTEAMRNSFNALEQEHRDLLIALLDAPAGLIDERALTAAVRRHHPGGLSRRPGLLIDRLTDHFLKIAPLGIGWVHPSWRDLVIDELAHDAPSRQRFLGACGVEGATLAVSHQGGALGERSLPLMRADADWDRLLDRLLVLLAELEPRDLARLLLALTQAVEELTDRQLRSEAESLASIILDRTRERWDRRHEPIAAFLLEAWHRLAASLPLASEPPQAAPTWIELHPGRRLLENPDEEELLRAEEWLAVARVLRDHDPERLAELGFHEHDRELLQRLILVLTRVTTGAASELRPLAESVLDRIADLRPELSYEAVSALTLAELARSAEAVDWWTPHDLLEPPSRERAATAGRFGQVDVERVLEDL